MSRPKVQSKKTYKEQTYDLDFLFSENNYEIDDDDTDDFLKAGKLTCDYLSQSLSNPLLDISLCKFSILLKLDNKLNNPDRIKSGASLDSETWFLDEINRNPTLTGTIEEREIFSAHTVAYFCSLFRTKPPARSGKEKILLNFKSTLEASKLLDNVMSSWTDTHINSYNQTQILKDLKHDELLNNYYSWMMHLEHFYDIRRGNSASGKRTATWNAIGPLTFTLTGQFMAYIEDNRAVIGTIDMYLCLLDIIRVRFNTRLACHVLKMPEQLFDLIEQQYLWQESCLIKYNESGYEILKQTESIWKCYVSRLTGGSYEQQDSLTRMVEKIKLKEMKILTDGSYNISTVNNWVSARLVQMSDEQYLISDLYEICLLVDDYKLAVELFGITKSTGHPVINPELGGESSRNYAKASMNTNPVAWFQNWWILKHLTLINYIQKHGRWPPIEFSKTNMIYEGISEESTTELFDYRKSKLYKLYTSKSTFFDHTTYDLSDWQYAEILQIFEFDYHKDYLHLLNDKSCAPPLKDLKKFYSGKNIDKASRRILRVMMTEVQTDTEDLINTFAQDLLSPDEYNILLYPKECEFKLAARMFCMLTFHMRLIFSIIQENVKQGIFSLMPYQSMTLDNQEVIKRLMTMTASTAKDETLFVEVDLSRWNLCFRDIFVRGFGRVLDSMYGVSNIFGRSHQVFARSLTTVLVRDQKIPQFDDNVNTNDPNMIDSDTMWRQHMGGFEGIDQATWTLCTICMIFRALWDEKCRFILLGQGDNQTLAISRPKSSPEPMRLFAERIMKKIEISCSEVNHEAKPEEFVDSTTTLTYSKVFIVEGAVIPMNLKFGSKIGPLTSSEIPSFFDATGSIHSAAIGASTNSLDPLGFWLLTLYHTEMLFHRFRHHGGWMGDQGYFLNEASVNEGSPEELLLMTIPSVIGGYPICSPTSYLCRNEPDPLTAELSLLRRYAAHSIIHARYLSLLLSGVLFHEEITSLDKLIQDPYSLPFTQQASQQSVLEKLALNTVRASAKNKNIKELINYSQSAQEQKFISDLSSMRPFYPLIAHDILRASIFGKKNQFCKKFNTTRTFITETKAQCSPHQRVLIVEKTNCLNVCLRMNLAIITTAKRLNRQVPSLVFANNLRKYWGDIQIEGLSTAHPLDYPLSSDETQMNGVNFISIQPFSDILETRGAFKPYLGLKTMEKRVGNRYDVVNSSSIEELKKLVLLATASSYNDNGKILLELVAATRTRYSVEDLCRLFPTTIGGIVAHRYELAGTSNVIGPVGNVMLASNLSINTNNIEGLSGTKKDFPIAFQQFFSYGISGIRLLSLSGSTKQFAQICLSVTRLPELQEYEIEFNQPSVGVIPTLRNNPLVYVQDVLIKVDSINKQSTDVHPLRTITIDNVLNSANQTLSGLTTLLVYLARKLKAKSSINEMDFMIKNTSTSMRLDTAVCTSIGPTRLLEASRWAIAYLTVNELNLVSETYPGKYKTVVKLNNDWSTYVCKLWVDQLIQNSEFSSYMSRSNLWIQNTGSESQTASQNLFYLNVSKLSLSLLTDWAYIIQRSVKLIYISKSNTLTVSEVNILNTSMLMWQDYLQLLDKPPGIRSSNHISAYPVVFSKRPDATKLTKKQACMYNLLALTKNNNSDIVLTRECTSDPCRYVKEKIKIQFKYEVDLSDLLFKGNSKYFFTSGIEALELSEEELQRWFRLLDSDSDKDGELDDDVIYQKVDISAKPNIVSTRRGEYLNIPEIPLLELEGNYPSTLTLTEQVRQRMNQKVGVNSSSFYKWAGAISTLNLSDNVCVIGSGAGGLQKALTLMKIKNAGYDLQSAIPKERLGDTNYRPKEILKYTKYCSYPVLNHTTSGDIFDLTVVESIVTFDNYNVYLIDIEGGQKRFGLRPIFNLLSVGALGTIGMKFFLTYKELVNIVSSIQEVGTNIKIYNLSNHLYDDDTSHTVIIMFKVIASVTPLINIRYLTNLQSKGTMSLVIKNEPDDRSLLLPQLLERTSLGLGNLNVSKSTDELRKICIAITDTNCSKQQMYDLTALYLLEQITELFSQARENKSLDIVSEIMSAKINVLREKQTRPKITIQRKIRNQVFYLTSNKSYILQVYRKIVPRIVSLYVESNYKDF